jgi:hypothetical protein
MVKIVAMELIFEPMDATMAAISAANTNPSNPLGSMRMRVG